MNIDSVKTTCVTDVKAFGQFRNMLHTMTLEDIETSFEQLGLANEWKKYQVDAKRQLAHDFLGFVLGDLIFGKPVNTNGTMSKT